MKLPRLTTRRAMVLVALAAIPLGLVARSARFRELAARHRVRVILVGPPSPLFERTLSHMEMAGKYERAARHPWLLVEPDPPGPE